MSSGSLEQLVSLTDEDLQILTAKRKAAITFSSAMGIVAVLLLAVLILLPTLFWLVFVLTFSLVTGLTALAAFVRILLLSQDLRLGQKQLVSGLVEAQQVEVTRKTDSDGVEEDPTFGFWIRIAGKKIIISEDQYYQFKVGDLAEAFIAPKSGIVLGVNPPTNRRQLSELERRRLRDELLAITPHPLAGRRKRGNELLRNNTGTSLSSSAGCEGPQALGQFRPKWPRITFLLTQSCANS
jgi:hypothetical protein